MTCVRRAVEDDIAELVRLRALLFETLGGDFFNPSSADDRWRDACAAALTEELSADTMRILVVDGDDGIAACGIGTLQRWLPGPHLPNGRIGHVIGVVTDPAYRRRGHCRAIMQNLLDWFREREAARVDLHASPDSEPLYRSLGFTDHPDPSLSWRGSGDSGVEQRLCPPEATRRDLTGPVKPPPRHRGGEGFGRG